MKTGYMKYVDVILPVKLRIPFNGAFSVDEVIRDLIILDNGCYDGIEIRRKSYDCAKVRTGRNNLNAQYMQLLNGDGFPTSEDFLELYWSLGQKVVRCCIDCVKYGICLDACGTELVSSCYFNGMCCSDFCDDFHPEIQTS